MTLRVLSLFAGIGGIDLGLERAGMQIVAHSEIDPYACRVLTKHWPSVPNVGDITRFNPEPWCGLVDVIAGGFPCQDISLAGKGEGIKEGTRSGLWSYYADAVRIIRPRYVIVENVAALLARGMGRVLGDLAAIGYGAWWDCVPAASVGAPHRRDRVFIVATRADIAPFDTDTSPMHWATQFRGDPHRDLAGAPGTCADAERISSERRSAAGDMARKTGASEANREQWERNGDAAEYLRAACPDTHGDRCEVSAECVSDQTRRIHSEQRDDTHGLRGPDERGAIAADRDGERGNGSAAEYGTHGRQELARNDRLAADRDDSRCIEQRWPVPEPSQLATTERGSWWRTEPNVGRVAHGIPRRVDRLRGLGNAVVPQIAQYIGELVVAHHERAVDA